MRLPFKLDHQVIAIISLMGDGVIWEECS